MFLLRGPDMTFIVTVLDKQFGEPVEVQSTIGPFDTAAGARHYATRCGHPDVWITELVSVSDKAVAKP